MKKLENRFDFKLVEDILCLKNCDEEKVVISWEELLRKSLLEQKETEVSKMVSSHENVSNKKVGIFCCGHFYVWKNSISAKKGAVKKITKPDLVHGIISDL